MDKSDKKTTRRDFLFTTSYTVGAVGLGAVIWPLIDQMNPDRAQKALATTEVDISQIEPGKSITVLWRGKPVFLKRRTQEEILEARSVSLKDLMPFDMSSAPASMFGHNHIICNPSSPSFLTAFNVSSICSLPNPYSVVTGC